MWDAAPLGPGAGEVAKLVIDPHGGEPRFRIRRCRRCDIPRPEELADALMRSGRKGFSLYFDLTGADLAEYVAESLKKNGARVDYDVRVVEEQPDRG